MANEVSRSVKITNKVNSGGQIGFVLFVSWVGAAAYFVQHSDGFWGFILALLKSFVWPAYVVHAVLGLLHIN